MRRGLAVAAVLSGVVFVSFDFAFWLGCPHTTRFAVDRSGGSGDLRYDARRWVRAETVFDVRGRRREPWASACGRLEGVHRPPDITEQI